MVSMAMIAGAFFHHFVIDLTMDSTVGTGKPRLVSSPAAAQFWPGSALAGASLPSCRESAIISSSAARACCIGFQPFARVAKRKIKHRNPGRWCLRVTQLFQASVRLMGQESSQVGGADECRIARALAVARQYGKFLHQMRIDAQNPLPLPWPG